MVSQASETLREGLEDGSIGSLRLSAFSARSSLSGATSSVGDAIQDWNDIHREAVREVLREAQAVSSVHRRQEERHDQEE
jgi:hypothetical protein